MSSNTCYWLAMLVMEIKKTTFHEEETVRGTTHSAPRLMFSCAQQTLAVSDVARSMHPCAMPVVAQAVEHRVC